MVLPAPSIPQMPFQQKVSSKISDELCNPRGLTAAYQKPASHILTGICFSDWFNFVQERLQALHPIPTHKVMHLQSIGKTQVARASLGVDQQCGAYIE